MSKIVKLFWLLLTIGIFSYVLNFLVGFIGIYEFFPQCYYLRGPECYDILDKTENITFYLSFLPLICLPFSWKFLSKRFFWSCLIYCLILGATHLWFWYIANIMSW